MTDQGIGPDPNRQGCATGTTGKGIGPDPNRQGRAAGTTRETAGLIGEEMCGAAQDGRASIRESLARTKSARASAMRSPPPRRRAAGWYVGTSTTPSAQA